MGAPGPIFAAAFALTLWRRHLFGPIAAVFFGDVGTEVLSGILAGDLGGGLLAAVTRLLAPIRWWPSLLLAGALLAALL